MTSQDNNVSQLDIYHKLGTLEGKVDALIAKTADYRTDLQIAFDRISGVEHKQAWIMGGAAVLSIVVPIIIQVISSSMHHQPGQNRPARNIHLAAILRYTNGH
ncbi:MAG: hypothetical protein ACO4CS_04035 [bacterium]|jgi:hypothetical protein